MLFIKSGADIKAICSEAGIRALRERRRMVTMEDLRASRKEVLFKKKEGLHHSMFL